MGQFDGKVAFITGAGRGQGRSHALRIAKEGAAVGLVDLGNAGKVTSPDYATATAEELAETKNMIEAEGGRALTFEADVRDLDALTAAADATAAEFGGIDFVVANAGVVDRWWHTWEVPNDNWDTVMDINLKGVFYTCKATIPHVIERGEGGSLVLVSSVVAITAYGYTAPYTVSKWGVRALSDSLAKELGPHGIRCNSLHPGFIDTMMGVEAARLSGSDTMGAAEYFASIQLINKNVEPRDTTAAVVWLLSDEARLVTGHQMVVDGGETKAKQQPR